MRTRDVYATARHWADEEADRMVAAGDPAQRGAVDLAEQYGVAVGWGPSPQQGPSGQPVAVAAWFVSLTRPHPSGQGILSTCDPIGSPEPDEAMTRAKVRAGITAIRAGFAQQAAGANGQPHLPH